MKKSKISDLSLRTKIFVFTMMPFVLVIIIISILSIQNRIKNERELTSNRIESYVTLLESGDLSFNSIKQKEKIEKLLNEKVLSAELIKRDRSIAFTTGGPEYEINKEQIDKAFQGYIITFTRQNEIPVQISLYPIIVKNTVVGILHLELSFEKSNDRIRQYTLFVLFLNIFGIILSFLLIYFLSKKIILDRLKSLTDMCSEIRRGNLNHRLSVKSHDEIGRLALTFNDMAEELAERNQQLKEEKQKVLDNIRELEKQVAMRKQADEELQKYHENLEEELKIYTYNPGSPRMNDAIYDKNGSVWVADASSGLVESFAGGWESMKINPGGPYSANVFSMTSSGNRVWVSPGGYTSTWAPLYLNYGAYRFYDDNWKNYNSGSIPELASIRDIVCIAINPANVDQTYLGIFRNEVGVLELTSDETTNIFTDENSELQKWEAAATIALVGLAYDSHNSLWALCSGAEKLLAEKKNDGSWYSYSLGGSASAVDCRKLFVDSYDQKWILFRHTNSNPNYVAVYNENKPPGEQLRLLRSGTGVGNIPGTTVFSIAQDYDGEVWIGTDEGIAIFYSPSDILTAQDYDAVRPLVNFDGYVQYLLETEVITAISVDGDNRKWIGTERSGIFLLSADGTEQIYHFTEDNSPLFSNQIIDIVINADGEVFVATASGIISYKGSASAPNETFTDVYAYPNPVKDGFDGWIAVKGLMQDSDIKITDISGTLIYSTRSEGGQAVWNGRNFDGRKARPGVYLVFASNEDGTEKMVTKILIID